MRSSRSFRRAGRFAGRGACLFFVRRRALGVAVVAADHFVHEIRSADALIESGPHPVLATDPGPDSSEWHQRLYRRAVNGGLIP
ncbi:hypothetical protein GCM10018791_66230 [Streptomyces zaomyceticus]|nr:hypothetical protein GCM10018791_66230 [Streptomyces zaomyceticus]